MINCRVADAVRQRRTPILRGMVRAQKSPLRVLREDLHRRVRVALNSVRYFFRIARGDFRDLNRAPILSKRAFLLIRRTEDQPLVATSLPSPEDVWKSAEETFRERGIWPISFSYPKEISIRSQESSSGLCPIYPGHSYSFTDHKNI